jgi:hypothetical protein
MIVAEVGFRKKKPMPGVKVMSGLDQVPLDPSYVLIS